MVPKIHQDFIHNSMQVFQNDLRIVGVAAGGSYITNSMDEFSDIDFVIAMKNGKLPRGVRKIEIEAPDSLPLLIETVPNYNIRDCAKA